MAGNRRDVSQTEERPPPSGGGFANPLEVYITVAHNLAPKQKIGFRRQILRTLECSKLSGDAARQFRCFHPFQIEVADRVSETGHLCFIEADRQNVFSIFLKRSLLSDLRSCFVHTFRT